MEPKSITTPVLEVVFPTVYSPFNVEIVVL